MATRRADMAIVIKISIRDTPLDFCNFGPFLFVVLIPPKFNFNYNSV